MDVAWDITKQTQGDVDEKIGAAACHDVNPHRRDWDRASRSAVRRCEGQVQSPPGASVSLTDDGDEDEKDR